jgi:hypothetical protein
MIFLDKRMSPLREEVKNSEADPNAGNYVGVDDQKKGNRYGTGKSI